MNMQYDWFIGYHVTESGNRRQKNKIGHVSFKHILLMILIPSWYHGDHADNNLNLQEKGQRKAFKIQNVKQSQ